MPRGVSTNSPRPAGDLLAGLVIAPRQAHQGWRAISARVAELESDAGGRETLSHAKRSLIQNPQEAPAPPPAAPCFLSLLCETSEMRFAAGETADVDALHSA